MDIEELKMLQSELKKKRDMAENEYREVKNKVEKYETSLRLQKKKSRIGKCYVLNISANEKRNYKYPFVKAFKIMDIGANLYDDTECIAIIDGNYLNHRGNNKGVVISFLPLDSSVEIGLHYSVKTMKDYYKEISSDEFANLVKEYQVKI